MNELLQKARDELYRKTRKADECGCPGCVMTRDLIAKIDSALAAPEPDAMALADKIYATRMSLNYSEGVAQIAALLESYKRVPREELYSAYSAGWCEGYKAKHVESDWIDEGFAKWIQDADKHGVKIEG